MRRWGAFLTLAFVLTGCAREGLGPWNRFVSRKIPEVGQGAPKRYVVRASQYAFTTDFEMSAKDPLVTELEEVRQLIAEKLDLSLAGPMIRIVIFENRDRYREFLRANFPELPDRRAFFIREGTDALAVFACRGERLRQDLRHEVTHALLHSVLAHVPLWLDEGLAEYFESADRHGAINDQHVERLAQSLCEGWEPDLSRLEAVTEMGDFGPEQYRESWLWVHFLVHHSSTTRTLLLDHVRELDNGPSRLPMESRLLALFPNPAELLVAHLKAIGPASE